jgi:hypothetical protein
LESKLKAGTWWAKGSPWHPTKGLTGKAWSDSLDATTRSVIALLSRAARELNVNTSWASYFRAPESFRGKEIRKQLPGKDTDLLYGNEKDYLSHVHARSVTLFESLMADLKDPTIPILKGLGVRIRELGESLKPWAILVDGVIGHRIKSTYPSDRKAKKAALKRPIKEVINELDIRTYVYAFDPITLGGEKPFRLGYDDLEPDEIPWQEVHLSYNRRIAAMRQAGKDGLADLMNSWKDATFWHPQLDS